MFAHFAPRPIAGVPGGALLAPHRAPPAYVLFKSLKRVLNQEGALRIIRNVLHSDVLKLDEVIATYLKPGR